MKIARGVVSARRKCLNISVQHASILHLLTRILSIAQNVGSAVFHGFLRGYLKADRFVRLIDHWRGAIQNNLVSKVSKFI